MGKKKISVSDSMGSVKIPADALYQAQTQRALDNFKISPLRLPPILITALALIKQSCATINGDLGKLDRAHAQAIASAAAAIAEGQHADQFPIDVFQTGSGTSSNMNLNEVIATLATDDGLTVDPNDHVNMGQSSNDVFPSAIHIAASLGVHEALLPAIQTLESALARRIEQHHDTIKTGRTHLMDAMPISLAQEMSAWASQLKSDRYRIQTSLTRLQQLAIGGTAVGTGINTSDDFGTRVCEQLTAASGIRFRQMENLFEGLSTQNTALELSGQLRVLATSLTKICNDLRWMNSGPLSGLGEISLKALQPGSSIMPAKVNPVIPEAVLMVAAQVNGNDTTIAQAASAGNFQLNVMLPVIAYNLLQSIDILANACFHLAGVIDDFTVNQQIMSQNLARNPILVTALNPIIGYRRAAEIAKQALRQNRPILDVAVEMTEIDEARLKALLDPGKLARNDPEKPE
ncbi:MAG: class II fumarate hydratase [Gammaproteobacteria bacterium]|nr:class II fumarate hydratase [Gammaproteobacteria bacterium]